MIKTNLIWVALVIIMSLSSVKDPFHSKTMVLLFQCYGVSITLFFFIHRKTTFPPARKFFNEVFQVVHPHLLSLGRILKNLERARIVPFHLSSLFKAKLTPDDTLHPSTVPLELIKKNFRKNFFEVPLSDIMIEENIKFLSPAELSFSTHISSRDQFFNSLNKKIFTSLLSKELSGLGSGPLILQMSKSMQTDVVTVLWTLWVFIYLKNDPTSLENIVVGLKELTLPNFSFLTGANSARMLEEIFFIEGKMAHRIHLLSALEKYLHLTQNVFRDDKGDIPSSRNLDQCYQLLQCHSRNSEGTIKKRFNKLALQLHPDRMDEQLKSPESLKKANSHFGQLNEAYQTVKRSRQKVKKFRQMIED